MNLTLELTDEETALLEAVAKERGADIAQVAHDVLAAHLPLKRPKTKLSELMSQWDAEDALAAKDPNVAPGLADWQQIERVLAATRLELPVPEIS